MKESVDLPKTLKFTLQPKSNEEQALSGARLALWTLENLGPLDGLVAIRQLENILGHACSELQGIVLAQKSRGYYNHFGATIRVYEKLDKANVPQLVELNIERKKETTAISEKYKLLEKTVLSGIPNSPKKRYLMVAFPGPKSKRILGSGDPSEIDSTEDEVQELEDPGII